MEILTRFEDEVNTVRQFPAPYNSVESIPDELKGKFAYRLENMNETERQALTRDELMTIEIDYSNMQRWYYHVKEHTPESIFIYLSLSELKEIRNKQKMCMIRGWNTKDYDDLISIEEKLKAYFPDEPIESISDKLGHYFFKMSSNSPKDIRDAPCYDETIQYYRSLCNSKGQYRKMCVHSPREVIYSMCNSERLYATMRDRPLGHYIVLRKWLDSNPDMEFRCFVYRGKITAISQYHSQTFYRFTEELSRECGRKILNFWNIIGKDFITKTRVDSWVMDVVILNKSEKTYPDGPIGSILNSDVKIIEFNGFGSHLITGSAQYCWKRDLSLIYRTDDVVTLRHLVDRESAENQEKTKYLIQQIIL